MTNFTTAGLPRPVIVPEVDFEATRQLRLQDFVLRMREAGRTYDVENEQTDTAVIAARSAAFGDLYYVQRLNDMARTVLLHSFAEKSDLDLHAVRAGLERFPGETDAALRERIRLAFKGKSAAGPDDYYKSRARNVDTRVRDVALTAVTRDSSFRVLILSVLTNDNGGLATPDLIAKLTTSLNDPSFRSRNVIVEVVPAVLTTRNVSATVWLYPQAVEPADGAKPLRDAFAADQRLGFDLTRSYVEKALHVAGAQRVELQGWTDSYAAFNEAIRLGAVVVQFDRVPS